MRIGGDSDTPTGPNRPPPKVASLGPFVGECGHVTDDEVRTLAGLGQIARVYKNADRLQLAICRIILAQRHFRLVPGQSDRT